MGTNSTQLAMMKSVPTIHKVQHIKNNLLKRSSIRFQAPLQDVAAGRTTTSAEQAGHLSVLPTDSSGASNDNSHEGHRTFPPYTAAYQIAMIHP
jgi:hypothetical protein